MEVKKNAIELLSELIILKLNLSISVPFSQRIHKPPKKSLFYLLENLIKKFFLG